jgi:2-dehydro-3-deoxygluconokinase
MEFDLISIGETMIAFAPPATVTVRVAASLLVDHAGAESNTCVGLARLGLRVAWVSRLGADAAGDRILDALTAEGIDTHWVERDAGRVTGLMIKEPGVGVRYYRSESAAAVMGPEILKHVPVAQARAVFVTGVTALIGRRPHAAALELLRQARGLRVVDPNLRKGLWGSDHRADLVQPLIAHSDLVLAGARELEEIIVGSGGSGRSGGPGGSGESAETLARRTVALGPKEVVVRGDQTVGALADGAWQQIDIRRGDAVDPIGAGDAFNAGYIAVRLRGGSIADALRAGVHCGTAVTTAVSDTAGFPRSL